MKRWEYKRLYLSGSYNDKSAEKKFNKLGNDGWELVSIYTLGENERVYAMFRKEKASEVL